jgi:hypothetical protein
MPLAMLAPLLSRAWMEAVVDGCDPQKGEKIIKQQHRKRLLPPDNKVVVLFGQKVALLSAVGLRTPSFFPHACCSLCFDNGSTVRAHHLSTHQVPPPPRVLLAK